MTAETADCESYLEAIRQRARPLAPEPTGAAPCLNRLSGIRAVLLDVYGTMFISGCGEVGTLAIEGRSRAVIEAVESMGLSLGDSADRYVCLLEETIRDHQNTARTAGIDYPEVDIVAVWDNVLRDVGVPVHNPSQTADSRRLAVEYETRANPTWPMPHLEDCLDQLYRSNRLLGIISNAQFYTPLLFPALVGRSLEELGFDKALQFFSYQHGHAKPGDLLFRLACRQLESKGIRPEETVYVGNDMLNDITGAAGVGMQTALFAGDARSLRLREEDERVAGVIPDLVLTDLLQLADCLENAA